MSRKAPALQRRSFLPFLLVLVWLLSAVATGPDPLAAQLTPRTSEPTATPKAEEPSRTVRTPTRDAETVIGGRVVASRTGTRRWTTPETGLAGAAAELFEFRNLYQVLEQTLAESEPPKPVATGRTDPRGFYDLPAPAYGRYTLRLSAPGRATDERTLIAFLPWEENPAVELAERREVTVQVLDPAGQPVAGARVVAWPKADESHSIETGLTGEDGKLTLPDAAGTPMRLAAITPGYAPAETIDSSEGTRGTAVLQLRTGLARRVEVRQGRGPAPEALVLLGDFGIPAGKTGEDGELEIWVPREESIAVRALASDLRSASAEIAPADPPDPETAETAEGAAPIRLALEPLPVVSGQVVDSENRTPLGGVLVWAPDAGEGLTTSDRAGGYRLALPDVPDRTFFLLAVLPGYVPQTSPIEPDQANGPLPTLVLTPAAAVSGIVVDSTDEPIREVEIQILGRSFRPRGIARSGEQGRFLVPSISPGVGAQLLAEKPGYAPTRVDIPVLEAGRTVSGLRVVLERGYSVAGQVVDAEDRPVAGAQVWLFPREVDRSPMGRFSRFQMAMEGADGLSGSEGGFLIEHVAEGEYDLRVEASGFAAAEVPGIELTAVGSAGDEPLDLGVVVLDSAVPVRGQVVDPDGTPLAGAQVRAVAQSGRFAAPRFDPSESLTDAEGRFSIGEFRNGDRVSVTAGHPGYAESPAATVQVPTAEPLKIVLEPAASIRGLVSDPDGRPVENAQVRIERSARRWGFGRPSDNRTDAEGRFSIPDVPPGEITILAWAEGYLPDGMVHLDVAPGAQLEGIEITLTPGATISGRVLGPDGQPLIQARVGLLSASHRGPGSGSVVTDGDGRYQLDGVPTGAQSLSASHGDHPPAVKDLEVRAGDNRLDFRLEAGSRVSGRVVDSRGGPVHGVTLWLQPINHNERRRATSENDGSFAFVGVPDGEYKLRGSHRELGEASLEELLAVHGSDMAGIELRFAGGTTIRGRVLGLNLDELAAIEITGYSDNGSNQWARPDYEGNFTLTGVAPGTWTLIATSSGQRVTERVEVAEGVSEIEVELEFRAGSTLAGRVMLGSNPMRQGSVAVNSSTTKSGGYTSLDHDGRFRIEGLDEGTYQLRIFGQAGVQYQEEVVVPTDGEVLITLEPAQLHGRVVDAVTGDPLSGVAVSLLPDESSEGAQAMIGVFGNLLTDTRGIFRVPEVAAGRYRLVLSKDAYSRTETPVAIDPGPSEGLEIRLQPSQGLNLQLSWAPGLVPSTWVQVTATSADGRVGLTDRYPVSESGLVRLRSLPPGSWQIEVNAMGSSAKVQALSPGPVVPVILIAPEG